MKPGSIVTLPSNGIAGTGPQAGKTVDEDSFRRTLGNFPTGVVAVTAMDGTEPVGMTVGTFFSVSLNPMLVGLCVKRESTTWPRIAAAGRFCVNVLAEDQATVARALAAPGARDRFAGTAWEPSAHDSPILTGAIARVECVPTASHPAGDHLVVVAAVRDLAVLREHLPLVHFRRAFHSLAATGSPPATPPATGRAPLDERTAAVAPDEPAPPQPSPNRSA
jgi:3-hydroxy-9,10-secoandrosta-1,3,5(10)-triene-9,17-dione monooxygenase reductase component